MIVAIAGSAVGLIAVLLRLCARLPRQNGKMTMDDVVVVITLVCAPSTPF